MPAKSLCWLLCVCFVCRWVPLDVKKEPMSPRLKEKARKEAEYAKELEKAKTVELPSSEDNDDNEDATNAQGAESKRARICVVG
jgi:hypothetical protein